MDPDLSLADQILLLERSLLQPEVRSSPEALADLLSDDFVEFGSRGRLYDKQQVIDALQQEAPREIVITDFQVRLLAGGVALATFRTVQEGESRQVLRSSLWQLADGRWRLQFHQGTPAGS